MLTWPRPEPTRRFRTSPAICAAERPTAAAFDGSTVTSIWRPALTRSLLTFVRSPFIPSVATRRSDAASMALVFVPVITTEIAFVPALKPVSSIVTVQPWPPIGSRSAASCPLAAARSASGRSRTVMRAAFGARPVVAATSVCVPVAFSPGIDVVTSSTEPPVLRRSYASRLRSSTTCVFVPSGGFTVMIRIFSLPLLRNCVGMSPASEVAPTKRTNEMANVATFVARRLRARLNTGR